MQPERLITLKEAATLSGLSYSHLALLARTGKIKAQRFGHMWLTTPEAVAAVIRSALEHTSPERIFPCTNCGMVPLPRSVSQGKLKALAAGAALVRAEL